MSCESAGPSESSEEDLIRFHLIESIQCSKYFKLTIHGLHPVFIGFRSKDLLCRSPSFLIGTFDYYNLPKPPLKVGLHTNDNDDFILE